MFEESLLIDRIFAITGYPTTYSKEFSIDDAPLGGTTTTIYVGHLGIKPVNSDKEEMISSGYAALESQKLLMTGVHIVCSRADFVTVYNNVVDAYKDWSPIGDPNVSSLFLVEGSVLAATNTRIHYREIVGVIFPRVY
jgi:hypothetical protein